MRKRTLAITAGISYLIIFATAIFANFFVLEAIKAAPLETVTTQGTIVRLGILAFLLTAIFDVIIAWALYLMYKKNDLSILSTMFRLLHAGIMGLALFALVAVFQETTDAGILQQVDHFNVLWLIGLFFFGCHLVLLKSIIKKPKFIMWMLFLAGLMYMTDTAAHIALANYDEYASLFLAMVAVPSILGEMLFALWLLVKAERKR